MKPCFAEFSLTIFFIYLSRLTCKHSTVSCSNVRLHSWHLHTQSNRTRKAWWTSASASAKCLHTFVLKHFGHQQWKEAPKIHHTGQHHHLIDTLEQYIMKSQRHTYFPLCAMGFVSVQPDCLMWGAFLLTVIFRAHRFDMSYHISALQNRELPLCPQGIGLACCYCMPLPFCEIWLLEVATVTFFLDFLFGLLPSNQERSDIAVHNWFTLTLWAQNHQGKEQARLQPLAGSLFLVQLSEPTFSKAWLLPTTAFWNIARMRLLWRETLSGPRTSLALTSSSSLDNRNWVKRRTISQ